MSDHNPIKYSDLIEDDGAIKKAIAELTALQDTYNELKSVVKDSAISIKAQLQSVNVATEEGKAATKDLVNETSRLKRAEAELAFALSETGSKVAELKMLTSEANRESKISAANEGALTNSYKDKKAQLEALINVYKQLDDTDRKTTGKTTLAAIQALRAEVKGIEADLKGLNSTNKKVANELSAVQKAQNKLTQAHSAESQQLAVLSASIKEANRVVMLTAQVNANAEGSYNRLSAQYELNKIALNKMSLAEREKTGTGMKMVEETKAMYVEMQRLQEVTGKHTLGVGNYKAAWDGVYMGVNQIVREAPVLGISMNTFFLAISNNLPILVDEINKVKVANKQALAEGLKQQSILKSVMRSIFSFNTGLIIVVTVLAKYGTKIFDWIKKMSSSAKDLDKVTTSTRALNKVMTDASSSAVGQVASIIEMGVKLNKYGSDTTRAKELVDQFNDTFKTHYERIEEIRLAYPALAEAAINSAIQMAAAQMLIQEAAQQTLRMAKAEKDMSAFSPAQVSKAKKDFDAMFKLYEAYLKKSNLTEKEIIAAKNKLFSEIVKGDFVKADWVPAAFVNTYTGLMREYKKFGTNKELSAVLEQYGTKAGQKLFSAIANTKGATMQGTALQASIQEMYDDMLDRVITTTTTRKSAKDRAEQIAKANLDVQKEYEESLTKLIMDEHDNRAKELRDAAKAETYELLNKQQNDKDLTKESRALITETILNIDKGLTEDLRQNEYDRQLALLDIQTDMLGIRLEATEENSYEELDLRLKMLEIERKKEITANKSLIESKRQDEAAINEKWDNIIHIARLRGVYAITKEERDQAEALAEAEFNIVRRTEREKNEFKLNADKKRYEQLIALAKTGTIDATKVEIKTWEALIEQINRMLLELKGSSFNIYEELGLDENQANAAKNAINLVEGYLRDIANAEKELADMAVEAARGRADAAKTALEAEIEARNNGYAHNITSARKELALAKEQERQKLAIAEKAARAQRVLDTLSQTSSLITAAANIWKSFSPLGPVGVALSIGAIATMFGTFAISKVKAAQVSKAQSEVTYGEGGLEILDGGSHASGNDIPIGRTKDGRARKAEGGEALIVINKRNTRKYRNMLPQVVDTINKGVFEQRYMNSFSTEEIVYNNTQIDLSKIESDVNAIRKNNETSYNVDGSGKMFRRYKNLTTRYL